MFSEITYITKNDFKVETKIMKPNFNTHCVPGIEIRV